MPFSAPCVSSCVVLRDATLSSSKPLTLVAAGTEKDVDKHWKHTTSFLGYIFQSLLITMKQEPEQSI